jgi:hypothetical protein
MNSPKSNGLSWALPTTGFVLLLSVAYFWMHGKSSNAPPVKVSTSTAEASAQGKAHQPTTQTPRSSAPALAAKPNVLPDGMVSIPARFQLPGVSVAKSGVNSKDWLAQFPADQQAKISAFNKRHFGLYQVNSREQVAWMAENGYPIPEDVIAAEKLSDADLRELAKQGNDKAGFMLRERTLDAIRSKLDEYHAQGRTDADFWSGDPMAAQISADELATTDLLNKSHSPYKGYVKAFGNGRQENQLAKDIDAIAGLEWALRLGDFRAAQFLNAYVQGNSNLEALVMVANEVSGDASTDSVLMKTTGCQNAGTAPGLFIPGDFAPVE